MFFNKSNSKQTLLNFAFILFLFSLIYRFTKELFVRHGYESWYISEFLINYEGGFVRRGLMGEILFLLAKNFDFDLEQVIKIFCLISFFTVCFFFIRAFLKKGYTLYILPLCFFLGMGAFNGFWIRKDYLMLLVLISILSIYKSKFSLPIRILTINILVVCMQLIHESFAFFVLPILFLLFFSDYKNKGFFQSILLSSVSLLPSAIAFLLTLQYHGDHRTVQSIWDSWVAVANLNASKVSDGSHGALSAISWSRESVFKMHFQTNFLTKNMNVFSGIFWSLSFPVVYYIATNALFAFRKNENVFTNKDKTNLSSILIFQLLTLIPFFLILSCDILRIFFYWIASSFILFLLIPNKKIEKIFPSAFIVFVTRINNGLANILAPTKTTLALLMLFTGLPIIVFSFESAIQSSLIYNVLWTLSYFVTTFVKIISIFF